MYDKIIDLHQLHVRLDDYKQNSLKVKKFKSLIRMVKRLRPEDEEDEIDHDEWVSDHIKSYKHTIKRLLERRTIGMKWI